MERERERNTFGMLKNKKKGRNYIVRRRGREGEISLRKDLPK
jgi:hypothetical protein